MKKTLMIVAKIAAAVLIIWFAASWIEVFVNNGTINPSYSNFNLIVQLLHLVD